MILRCRVLDRVVRGLGPSEVQAARRVERDADEVRAVRVRAHRGDGVRGEDERAGRCAGRGADYDRSAVGVREVDRVRRRVDGDAAGVADPSRVDERGLRDDLPVQTVIDAAVDGVAARYEVVVEEVKDIPSPDDVVREPHPVGAALALLRGRQRVLHEPGVAAVERRACDHAGERLEVREDHDVLPGDRVERDLVGVASAGTERGRARTQADRRQLQLLEVVRISVVERAPEERLAGGEAPRAAGEDVALRAERDARFGDEPLRVDLDRQRERDARRRIGGRGRRGGHDRCGSERRDRDEGEELVAKHGDLQ